MSDSVDERRHWPARALLLDMDGVLVDSTNLVEVNWARWARRRGLDPALVMPFAHGTPSREVVARFVPAADVSAEADWVEGLSLEPAVEIALPGAAAALTQTLLPVAIVTSASGPVARLRLERAGLVPPAVLVTADDVTRGKPDPEPYLLGARLLGVAAVDCVGVEDTPAGVSAIRAAGATALALLTTHRADQLGAAAARLANLSVLRVTADGVSW